VTRPLRALHDDALAAALRDAGRTLPGARRDIAAALTPASLAARQGVARRLRRPPSRRAVLVAAALLLVVAGSALAAGVVPGIELRRSPQQTDTTGPPLVSDDAFLGTRTTLRAARATVDFPIRVPELPGHPQVYVAGTRGRQRVSLLYGASDDLPPIGPTRAGLLVTQFRGHADDAVLRKIAGPGVDVAAVSVGDAPAWWISGAHEVAVLDGDRVVTERVRYADRTLLWSLDGVTLRVEAAVPRAQAIALAASMR
jgi:hypothetical protein